MDSNLVVVTTFAKRDTIPLSLRASVVSDEVIAQESVKAVDKLRVYHLLIEALVAGEGKARESVTLALQVLAEFVTLAFHHHNDAVPSTSQVGIHGNGHIVTSPDPGLEIIWVSENLAVVFREIVDQDVTIVRIRIAEAQVEFREKIDHFLD